MRGGGEYVRILHFLCFSCNLFRYIINLYLMYRHLRELLYLLFFYSSVLIYYSVLVGIVFFLFMFLDKISLSS